MERSIGRVSVVGPRQDKCCYQMRQIAEEDWNAINETLYLLAVPWMRKSVINGMSEPLECAAIELDW